jgi:hypothetical protein
VLPSVCKQNQLTAVGEDDGDDDDDGCVTQMMHYMSMPRHDKTRATRVGGRCI